MKITLSRLKIGNIFIYNDMIYEIIGKDRWTTYCKYPNEKYKKSSIC